MKILIIIFSLYMMSGPVGCIDLIGYTGGSVLIYCLLKQYKTSDRYFCKEPEHQCVYMNSTQTQNTWDHKGRVSLFDSTRSFSVLFRNLSVQDNGSYQCGETGVKNHYYNLKVKTDPCCVVSETVIGYLRETVTITCSYPEEFKTNYKAFIRLEDQYADVIIHSSVTQTGRFSISDDKSSKVLSVNIRDVKEDDGGDYSCAVWDISAASYSLFRETHLQVTGEKRKTQKPKTTNSNSTLKPTASTSTSAPDEAGFTLSIIIIIITVTVCVVLMLTGGSALIFYRLRVKKTEGSVSSNSQRTENNTTDVDYENDAPRNLQNISMGPIYQSLEPYTNQLDSLYHTLNPNTSQSDSIYQSLDPKKRESDVYHSLNPRIS